jgi:uncharacterized protein YqeY
MSLLEKIKTDMWDAKKTGNKIESSLLNTLYSDAALIGKNKGQRDTTDEEVVALVKNYLKKNAEALELVKGDANATALYHSEKVILERYLPQQLSDVELEGLISSLKDLGKNMGEIMKHLKESYAGRYDGQKASEIAKRV